ncbi:lysophospholipid acyltransferase family protein [Rhodothermus profundi]|uniref:1-acyl-sn-glycerol-3-phosphate acyltransferase n=1 Tax=Rhodothermus profundi TaxID=633813 RepID=A0A1M6Q8R7_9BACT|nr:lysophospholipid acyltransferase family protein [Rhodothermus profundi]SHK16483.1 1-acyl-sn-glycerol-3-phosphate acyltransferase [Rhodothermus profundi]
MAAESVKETSSIAPLLAPAPVEAPVEGAPPATLWTRLHFFWFVGVGLLSTLLIAPLQVITHRFRPTAANFKKWARRWAGMILRACGWRVVWEDRARLSPGQPCLFVANHQCALDILVLSHALPYPFGFVAKAELERVPVLGWAMRHSASLFIDRNNPRRSLESLRLAGERIRQGHPVLLFPEGTRGYRPELRPFKKGAFLLAVEAGVPLIPVVICDSYRCLDERRMVSRPGTIRVVIGEPVPTEGLRRRHLATLMDTVQARMQAMLREAGNHA